jgi:PiT family inorganic phosphate transporter
VVLAGLVGAIVWDLLTWWWGLPTSSSHALIGGFAGAGVAHAGWSSIRWDKMWAAIKFIPLAPILGMAAGFALMLAVYWLFRKWRPAEVDRVFRRGQLVSAALYSLGHGGNDAQKTMGLIVALLVAAGHFDLDTRLSITDPRTLWIILSCHAAMALGTAMGGWRIVKTMGQKLTKLKPVHGFCAETAGAATIFLATHLGIPVSTTHTISGSIVGVGSIHSKSSVKWQIAGRIVVSWFVTIPFSALVSAGVFALIQRYHP